MRSGVSASLSLTVKSAIGLRPPIGSRPLSIRAVDPISSPSTASPFQLPGGVHDRHPFRSVSRSGTHAVPSYLGLPNCVRVGDVDGGGGGYCPRVLALPLIVRITSIPSCQRRTFPIAAHCFHCNPHRHARGDRSGGEGSGGGLAGQSRFSGTASHPLPSPKSISQLSSVASRKAASSSDQYG